MSRPSTAESTGSASSSEYESYWPETPSSPAYHHTSSKVVGPHKVHYQPHSAWDHVVSAEPSEPSEPIDIELMLPHYRAHNQPLNHRMSMYIRSQGEVKAKVCRRNRSPFLLRVDSTSSAPVTIYLPSDFSGTIRFPMRDSRLTLSAGFTNCIRPRVRFFTSARNEDTNAITEDELEVYAAGPVQLRMWDVLEGAPERIAREAWRKFCRRASSKNLRAPADTRPIDWDFLLDD
ncbi:hypothetical protein K488DRAFT_85939 [Vararia minispora EC-137]|uniref:Uncharacterized protein n=1 Tax=Vararia minispora EC-137 TaxID=1314806 RepID=A0ACB8QKY3_9AGAM|nr:hypothetical protein K488DRAFT_85939 [Vararia minispora EC-137]